VVKKDHLSKRVSEQVKDINHNNRFYHVLLRQQTEREYSSNRPCVILINAKHTSSVCMLDGIKAPYIA